MLKSRPRAGSHPGAGEAPCVSGVGDMDSAEPAGAEAGDLSAEWPAVSRLRCGEEEPDKERDEEGGKSGDYSWEQSLNPELQQGYRILREFLLEKYRPLTAPFLKPLADQASIGEEGAGSLSGRKSSHSFQQLPAGMWLLKMEEKFSSGQYTGIADFVGDFRLMLETCYRLNGVDHWLSKQAQKLEMMLEQKLALLSRHLREKTSIAVTSRGCYGLEDEKGTACISTRRRSMPRNLGPAHRLEAAPPDSDKMPSVLHLSDLSADEEDVVCCRMNEYEKKIDSLINAVGMMKEAKLQEKEEHKQLTERLLEEQKEQLNEVTQELVETEHENTLLRRNMERIREEKDMTMLEKKYLQREKECLMSKLSEAERDASAATRQIRALENTIGRLNIEKHMSSSDINALTRQKELLLQKLTTFEETNQTLRQLLKEQHNKEKDAQKLMVRQKILLKRLADSDAENVQLQMKLQEKEKEMESLGNQIQAGKDQAKAVEELSKSMEAMKAHLQAQLRGKEAESNRLTVQLRNLERGEAQHKAEVERIVEQLKEVKQKADRDKEALKKALRAQKERAERSEEYAEQLTAQLTEKDGYVAEALSSLETWRNRHDKAVKDRSDLELEIVTLTSRLADLLEEQATREDKVRDNRDKVPDKVHRQNSETSNLKMENERLKASMAPMEEKLKQAQAEVQQLRISVKNYEGMIENYKSQILKTQMEAEDAAAELEKFGKENKALKEEKNNEVDLSYKQLQSRLAELEKLPEILKMKESQIAEYKEQLQNYERKNVDLSVLISDLRQQIELQGDKMEMTRERCHSAQEDKKQLTLKVEELERKLESTSAQNIEFLQVIAKREESIHQCQLRLDEKTRECSSLARQLEMAIEDAKRQVEQTRERAMSRERAAQSKMLDLETQLSRNKTELNQLRRSKDDAEHRYESRLQDLKDRLEQSESTNRSMQNYVQFLKSSYANVFGESALLGSLSHSRSSP